jgi:hypothetical protein
MIKYEIYINLIFYLTFKMLYMILYVNQFNTKLFKINIM